MRTRLVMPALTAVDGRWQILRTAWGDHLAVGAIVSTLSTTGHLLASLRAVSR